MATEAGPVPAAISPRDVKAPVVALMVYIETSFLNVIDADAETNTYALFVNARADFVSVDPIVHALEKCLPLSFQHLAELRQRLGIHAQADCASLKPRLIGLVAIEVVLERGTDVLQHAAPKANEVSGQLRPWPGQPSLTTFRFVPPAPTSARADYPSRILTLPGG
jgi:hypothetical protein